MTFYENINKNLLRRLLTGILYTGIEPADTGQLDSNNQPTNNPASGLDPGRIWVRVGDPQRSAVVAWNALINNQITNIPVLVGINRFSRGLTVLDLDIPRAAARFGDAITSLYAQPSGDLSTTTTRGRNFKPGRVFVSSGLTVKAAPFFYKDSADAIKYWDALGTVTITPPSASGGTDTIRWTIIALNPDATTPALVAIDGTEQLVTLPAPPSLDDLAAIAITDGYYPLAAAKVTTGDTTVTEASWVDFRLYFDKDGATSGMTSFTISADSGSDQTISNGNTIEFVGGTGIDTVASATDTITINIDSTVATLTGAQVLTNKTIDGDTNTVQDLPLTSIKTVAGDAYKVLRRDSSGIPVSTFYPGVQTHNTGTNTVGDSTNFNLTNNTEDYDEDGMYSGGVDNTRHTMSLAGRVELHAVVRFASNATGIRRVRVLLNGTAVQSVQVQPVNGTSTDMGISYVGNVAATDYFQIEARQTSGGDLATNIQFWETHYTFKSS